MRSLLTSRLTYLVIISLFLMSVKWILSPVFWLLSFRRGKKLKPIEDPLLTISATCLAEKIRRRQISSEEIVKSYIRRIQEVNPTLNAVVEERFTAALHDSKLVDKFLSETKLTEDEIALEKPLLGLPLTVKESCKLKGLSFAVGSKQRLGFVAEKNGEAVAKLGEAGAIPLLVSNTPDMCFGMECDNYITGTTNNPYNTTYMCGGSSGGEGALLGAGASLIGLGSDIGGSIRVPCMFNGIFGHKPSAGVVPTGGHYPMCDDEGFEWCLCNGPMVRYAEDLTLLVRVLAGNNLDLDESVDLDDVTVFFMEDNGPVYYIPPVEEEIKVALRTCVDHLRNRGSRISDVKFPELSNSFEFSASFYFGIERLPDVLVNQNNPKQRYSFFLELIKFVFSHSTVCYNALGFYLLDISRYIFSSNKDKYNKERCNELKIKITRELGSHGVLLYPTIHCSAFPHKQSSFNWIGISYSMIFNVMGFPSTHVPLGLNKKGFPVGIQIVAGPNRDVVCLAMARELEKAFGGWVPPPN